MKKTSPVLLFLLSLLLFSSMSCMSSGNINQTQQWQPITPGEISLPSELSQKAESQKAELMKAFAKGLREDAYTIQSKGNYVDAAMKYRRSLAYWPDPELGKYVQQVEQKANLPLAGNLTQESLSPVTTVVATIRNRSKKEVHIFTQGESPGADNLFRAGEIRTIPVKLQAQGTVVFSADREGVRIDSQTWQADRRYPNSVPSVLFDDQVSGGKLTVMTGINPID